MKNMRLIKKYSQLLLAASLLAACGASASPSTVGPRLGGSTVDLAAQSPESLYKLAMGFENSGDYAQALTFYGHAIAGGPAYVKAWLGIARILKTMGNLNGARQALADSLLNIPNNVALTLVAAEVEILDDHASAAIIMMAPIVNHPDYRVSNMLGVASEMMGSPTVARDYYADALAFDSSAPDVLSNLALSFAFSGDQMTAVALLQDNLKRSDYRQIALEQLALIYAIDGQLDAAMTLASELFGREDAANNFGFYEALQYLTPQMQARAVFTKHLSDDMRAVAAGQRAKNN